MLNINDETENDSVENEITKINRSLLPKSSDNCHLQKTNCDYVFKDNVMTIESSKIMLNKVMIMKMLKIKGEPQQVKFFRQLQFPECHLWRFCCGQCHSKNGED